jgi:hypothetical protein
MHHKVLLGHEHGVISIDERGNSQMPIELRVIRNGKFEKLE